MNSLGHTARKINKKRHEIGQVGKRKHVSGCGKRTREGNGVNVIEIQEAHV